MKIVVKDNTAGLTSGYQRTGISTSSFSAVETTAGYLVFNIATLPWYSPLLSNEEVLKNQADLDAAYREELAKAYKAMSIENRQIAEESLPIALEGWPAWED